MVANQLQLLPSNTLTMPCTGQLCIASQDPCYIACSCQGGKHQLPAPPAHSLCPDVHQRLLDLRESQHGVPVCSAQRLRNYVVKHAEADQVGCCDLERLGGLQSDDWDSCREFDFESAINAIPLGITSLRAQD